MATLQKPGGVGQGLRRSSGTKGYIFGSFLVKNVYFDHKYP